MRLEHLFDMELRYVGESVWLRPYGEKEAAGFGQGDGTLRGPGLSGRLTWANHPRRREDGVWCPDLHGYVTTEDGAKILVTMQGYSILEKAPGEKRAIVAACTFRTSHETYRWLNLVIAAVEGEIDEETEKVRMKAYACVNEIATGPAAIP
ncbi:MAG: DUF3237 family protein [Thermoplasmata archaeon]